MTYRLTQPMQETTIPAIHTCRVLQVGPFRILCGTASLAATGKDLF
jgi:hypothetical protein